MPNTHPTERSVHVLSPGSVPKHSLPCHLSTGAWECGQSGQGRAGVSCNHANDYATLRWRVPWLHVPVPDACFPVKRAPVSSLLKQLFSFLHTAFAFLLLAWCCVWPHRPCRLFLLTAVTSPYGSHYHKLLPSLKPVCKWVDCRQQGGQVHVATRQAPRIGLDRYVGLDECPLKPN